MQIFSFARYALSCIVAAMLAACSAAAPPTVPLEPAARALDRPSRHFKTLHVFKGTPDGAAPYGPLVYLDGELYGTTVNGGTYNAGTVFRMSPSGRERVIHSFGANGDGVEPYGGLIAVNGKLYGTTYVGGPHADGTFFSITRSGSERVIHGFDSSDGSGPEATPLAFNGTFYGTTAHGGAYDSGTVFSVDSSGKERVLYSFGATNQDGRYPTSNLVASHGALYGTTYSGGSKQGGCYEGCGTVFSVDQAGKERIVYSFGGLNYDDGYSPIAGLLALHDRLYGTTFYGGSQGYGTVFSVSASGKEKILLSFGASVPGAAPYGGLADDGGVLYGTTQGGVTTQYGTIFKAMTSGGGGLIYNFQGQAGANPSAALLNVSGILYGTTSAGGSANAGTVFAIVP